MRKIFNISVLLLAISVLTSQAVAQETVLATFENGMTSGTKFVDTWEASPFNTGQCSNAPEVIVNPYADNMNPTSIVLHYIRPYYAGDRNGVEIKLETPFNLTTETQYVHIFIYKPVSSRILLRGLDTENNTFQFQVLSSSESRAGAWSDAVFAVKGSNYTIDRLVLYPDLESSVNRLSSDIDIYIDEIVINSSSESRSVSDYCNVGGTITSDRYISSITTTGASTDISITSDARTAVYEKYASGSIVAIPGGEFTVEFVQKSNSGTNEAWVADVYADFNADKEFVSEGEYIGRISGVASGDEVVYTADITVPETTAVSSCMIRIKLTDSSDDAVAGGAYSSCSSVVDGYAINIPMEISEYAERPIIKITGQSDQSDWGAVKFKGYESGVTELMIEKETAITVTATPNAGYRFKGWYNQETGGLVSVDTEYRFSPDYNIILVARFEEIPFCMPEYQTPAKYYLGKASITPASQSALYYVGSSTSSEDGISSNIQRLSILGGVNVKRGTTFSLYIEKANSSAALSSANVALWADWDKSHSFDSDEYIGSYNITSSSNTFNVTVPDDAVKGDVYLRLIMTDNELTETSSCDAVGTGAVYDFMVTVTPGDDERFSINAVPSISGAATFTLSPEPGTDGKYAAGTNVEITCVPGEGFQFVQWLKDGMPYGATMTSNNPLPLTGLDEDLNLTMKVEAKFPEYCAGTTPNNGDGDHYGISGGSLSVNGVQAFTFSKGSSAITDLSGSCIAEVCPGDVIQLYVSGGDPHSSWAQGIAYVDWNMDGEWNTTTEAYELFNDPGAVVKNKLTEITVPDDVAIGCFGMRLCSGEAPAYNTLGGGPCQARRRGTLFTFRINSSVPPTSVPKLTLSQGEGCTVAITDSEGNPMSSGDEVEAGESLNIEVSITDENYLLDKIRVNGVPVAYTESGDNVYTATVSASSSGANVVVTTREKAYCTSTATITRTDRPASEGNDNRYLTAVKITGATYNGEAQTISINGLSQDAHRCVYEDHTDQVLKCSPGDVLTPTLTFNGAWMHKYVYVDWDRNYTFDVGTSADWKELVSFNYIDGVNSAGATAAQDGSAGMGTFVVPEDASGEYRIRFKLDWDSTDPCGRFDSGNSILNNAGGIVDFILDVDNPTSGVEEITDMPFSVIGGSGKIYLASSTNATVDVIDAKSGLIYKKGYNVIGNAEIQLPAGVYLVKVETSDSSEVKKVIVR